MEYNESEFLIETVVPKGEQIISRTDLNGIITHANDTFARVSGYTIEELVGQPHNIVRHPDMPRAVFKELWDTIQCGKQWSGVIKNLRKDRGYYWVHALVSGVYKDGELIEYKSLRRPIQFEQKCHYQKAYDRMKKEDGEKCRKVIYE